MTAQCTTLPDGRLHLQHGPMDIVIGADGDAEAVREAHVHAWQRFRGLLQELVAELPALRAPIARGSPLHGPVARRMGQAVRPYRDVFVTPMAAVAGAVAQELVAFYQCPGVRRAWVNNGGDIALHLTAGEHFRIGLFADVDQWPRALAAQGLAVDGVFDVTHDSPVRGVATSGWKGRSFSLGIADSVTVLARTAAQADAAATIVANAVNVADARIVRRPAWQVRDDSDLGAIPVTVDVPALPEESVRRALHQGLQKAQEWQSSGLLWFALLACQGQFVATSAPQALTGAAWPRGAVMESEVGSVFA